MDALAYIRRSASEESPVSEEAQRSTVARLAAERGDTIVHVYRDWGRSGGSETRPEYLAMLARLEQNGIGAVYAYDQDRLARSNWLFAGLLRLADLHGFAIVTPSGNLADERHRDFAEMRGVMDGAELRKMRRRAQAINAKQARRGDERGVPPYGYAFAERKQRSDEPVRFVRVNPDGIAHVVDTYRRTGTYLAAAKALNREGFPSQYGKTWHPVTVKSVIAREAPDLIAGVRRGTRGPGRPRLLAGILRCYCGATLTPGALMGRPSYYCARGQRGMHGRPRTVTEAAVLPWIKAEAALLRIPYDEVRERQEQGDRDALTAKRERLLDLYADGTFDRATLDRKVSAVDAELERLHDMEMVIAVPPTLDWTWEAEDINRWLRAAFDHIQLGPDLEPVEAVWRVPEWRESD
jgi:DNA invertase Pin-like site-specific DNA recombinase